MTDDPRDSVPQDTTEQESRSAPVERGPRKRLGDYDLLGELGRGGMGVVYEARQLSLDRRVALKVLPPGLGLSVQAVQRFEREARAAAKLHHTNIVPVYAIGREEGCHYYAMELIEGQPLSDVLRDLSGDAGNPLLEATVANLGGDDPSTPDRPEASHESLSITSLSDTQSGGRKWFDAVARLIAEVADALEYAHGRGIIHRDVKPSNLMLSRDGRLCITDFGLARVAQDPGMTVSGSLLGTPAYMSPEQIAVGRMNLDHRTDVYSLGAVLYELLAQQRPFPGESREEILGAILTKDPRPPRRFNPRVPVDLETIALKALEKDPDRRYASAGEMAHDLRQYLDGGLITARRASLPRRVWKSIRRHPVAATTVSAVVLLGILGTFAWQAASGRNLERAMRALAEARHALDQGEYRRGLELADEALRLAPALQEARVVRARSLMMKENLRAAADEALAVLERDPDEWTAHLVLAAVGRGMGDIDVDEHVARVEALAPDTADSYYLRALLAASAGETVSLLDRALELDPAHARALAERCNRHLDLKEYGLAMADADRLVAVRTRSARGRRMRGHVFRAQQRFEEALAEYERAIELDPDDPINYNERAKLHQQRGETEAALADIARALELDPGIANYHARSAFFNRLLKRNEAAVADARRALTLNPTNRWAYTTLLHVYRTSGQDREFDRTSEELRTAAESWVDADAQAGAYTALLDAFQLAGRTEEFERTAADGAAAAQAWLDPSAREWFFSGLAFVSQRAGDHQRALEAATLAAEAMPDNVNACQLQIRALQALGDDAGFEATCDALAAMDLGEPEPLRQRASNVGWACNRWERALELIDAVIEEFPNWYTAHGDRGAANFFLGRLEEAAEDLTRAIELNPYYQIGYNNRAAIYERVGRYEEQFADLERAVELNPTEPNPRSNLGIAKLRRGLVREALADYDKAIELDPFFTPAHANRGTPLAILGDCDGAIEAIDRALELNPDANSLMNLAGTHTGALFHFCPDRYDPATALELATRALESSPDEPAMLGGYGAVLYRNGRYREALDYTMRSLAPAEYEASFYSAMCLWQLGRKAEARDHFEKAAAFMDDGGLAHPSSIREREEAAALLGVEP